jgi:tungstate transport system ATP-binding protein
MKNRGKEPAYSLRDIRFSYPGRRSPFSCEIDTLEIGSGDIVSLVGPNGSGKTTLLMLLAFLLRPGGGRMAFRGSEPWADPEGIPKLRRRAVLVTHHPFLFKGTVGENLAFGLKIRDLPVSEWGPRISDALSLVELEGWESRAVAALSAGQAQRVALARAMVLRPEVVLLDEPTANIETGLAARIEAVIRELSRVKGTTVVFSTHNFSQASRLADDIVFLSAGRRVPFGHENCFSGLAETDGQTSWIEPKPGLRIVFPGAVRGRLTCLINPSSIRISPGESPRASPGPNVFSGNVTRLETTEEGLALVRVQGDLTFRATVPLEEFRRLGVSLSQNVLVRFSPESVEIVRGQSGASSP